MSRIQLHEFVEKVDRTKISLQSWSHLGVTTKEVRKILFGDILIDDISGNTTKVVPHTPEEIEALKREFLTGVDLSAHLPAVTKIKTVDGEGVQKFQWKLVYGFGRCEALQGLGQKEYLFVELEGCEDAIDDVKAQENEPLPQRRNTEDDMFQFISEKITSGKVKKTVQAIKAKLKKVYHSRPSQTITKIVDRVLKTHKGIRSQYRLYTSSERIIQWYTHYNSSDLVCSNNYDPLRDMYGRCISSTYLYRLFLGALETYRKTGKFTYFTTHLKAPTKKKNHLKMMQEVYDQYTSIIEDLRYAGIDVIPLVFEGFLPHTTSQNPKYLIVPNEVAKLKAFIGFDEDRYQAVQKSRTGLFKTTP